MLRATFLHVRGITQQREQELWSRGIRTLEDLRDSLIAQLPLFSEARPRQANDIDESIEAVQEGRICFFASRLPKRELFRVALDYPKEVMFLDIETTGLSKFYDQITVIGWMIGSRYQYIIGGDDPSPFFEAYSNAKAVVTFNGTMFDIPFLKESLPTFKEPTVHVDLRFLSRRVGLVGGQKKIEHDIGWTRPNTATEVKGEHAPVLWYQYVWGENTALTKLLVYNLADVAGMKVIFDECVSRLKTTGQIPKGGYPKFFTKGVRQALAKNDKQFSVQSFKGHKGPHITLGALPLTDEQICKIVVGIDLTGSERRASGWCALEGHKSDVALLNSDTQLIERTMAHRPLLVSIDSPLSLPAGRTSVFDDDPARSESGIMRHCERVLKQRGVNVYPALIQSMQRLTERGIRLASQFRTLGVPVIESYPGAAQDIIGVPRKGVSEEFLARHLEEFGIRLKEQLPTHDELDAITSAIVGYFFLSGYYEALGNPEEDYLIVPDLSEQTMSVGSRRIIGLSGPIAAGKTYAGMYLSTYKGFAYLRYSHVLAALLKERGEIVNRSSLQRIGERINKEKGQRWLNKELITRFPKTGDVVVDGLRFPEDHAFMIERFGFQFKHIHIEASNTLRRHRYVQAGGSRSEFDSAMAADVEASVRLLPELANSIIGNDRSKRTFRKHLLRCLES